MTLADAIKDDWKLFDGVVDATITKRLDGSQFIVKGLPRALNKEDMTGDTYAFDSQTRVWNLWVSTMPDGYEPREGDIVMGPDNVVWYVKTAQLMTLDTRWRAICVRQKQ